MSNSLSNKVENGNCISLQDGIIYGPVFSRRLGRSFGINLLSTRSKICSFDCIYCEYGLTGCHTAIPPKEALPSVEEVLFAVEKLLRKPRSIDCLTFSGNGEPTLHPNFSQIVKGIRKLRDDLQPSIKLAVFSNGSQLNNPDIFSAMTMVDLPMMKLDGGDVATLEKINRPISSIHFEDIFNGLKALPRIIVQTMFINGTVTNIRGDQYHALANALTTLKPSAVHIYSVERPPAMKYVRPVSPDKLTMLQKDLSDRYSLNVKAFWR